MPPNLQTAVAVIEPSAPVVYNLDAFPEDKFNRLIPTETIRIPTDLLVPVVQVVRLSLNESDKDVYSSRDIPEGRKAPTARGLNKFATAAGVSFYDERRTDDGSNPDLIGVTVMASMLLPTGQRITAPGSKQVDLSAQTWSSPAQRAKYKSFFYEHVSTRARNRAIRALLSLKSSYTIAELQKPFAVVSFAPNMDHPLIRQRMIDNLAPAVEQLYGGAAGAPQIGPGAPVQDIREITDGDDDAQDAAGDPATGDDDLPAFLRPGVKATEDAEATLLVRIRDTAASGGMHGAAKQPQLESLGAIFTPLGGRATKAGLKALWPELNFNDLTANQAQAIIGTSRTYETAEAFQDAWRAMAVAEETDTEKAAARG